VGYVAHTSAFLTIFGSLFILLTYFLFPSVRHQGRQLLCFLSAMDLLMATAIVIPPNGSCEILGLLSSFGASSSFFWSCGISLYVYTMLFYDKRVAEKVVYWLHFFAWGYPAVCHTYLILIRAVYAQSELSWCAIAKDQGPGKPPGYVLRWITVWGPVWVSVLVSLIVNLVIWRRFRQRQTLPSYGFSSTEVQAQSEAERQKESYHEPFLQKISEAEEKQKLLEEHEKKNILDSEDENTDDSDDSNILSINSTGSDWSTNSKESSHKDKNKNKNDMDPILISNITNPLPSPNKNHNSNNNTDNDNNTVRTKKKNSPKK